MRRESTTFEELHVYRDLGVIVEMISDDRTFIIVSNYDGELIYLDLDEHGEEISRTKLKEATKPEERPKDFDEKKNESSTYDCITCMKLTPDGKYLVGYWEKSPLEVVKIWNLTTLKSIHEEILDLDDKPELTEDPNKLMVLSNDGMVLYLRSDNRKGVKIISLQDGALVGEIKNLHTNPILQILVTKD